MNNNISIDKNDLEHLKTVIAVESNSDRDGHVCKTVQHRQKSSAFGPNCLNQKMDITYLERIHLIVE